MRPCRTPGIRPRTLAAFLPVKPVKLSEMGDDAVSDARCEELAGGGVSRLGVGGASLGKPPLRSALSSAAGTFEIVFLLLDFLLIAWQKKRIPF